MITVSNKVAEKIENKNIKTIYNGIEFYNVDNSEILQKYKIPQNKFLICSVGRLCDVKRFDLLIKSIKDLDVFVFLLEMGKIKIV